jgi:hypothetical protein
MTPWHLVKQHSPEECIVSFTVLLSQLTHCYSPFLCAECRGTKECRGLFNLTVLVNNIMSLTRSLRNNYWSLDITVLKLVLTFAGPHSNHGILEGGKLSTVDLLILTSLDKLLLIMQALTFFRKQATLKRRSTVLSLPFSKLPLLCWKKYYKTFVNNNITNKQLSSKVDN